MGAINFIGGSWCGGGYGKTFTFELDHCLKCGGSDWNDICPNPDGIYDDECSCNFYDYEFESELFRKLSGELTKIEDLLIEELNDKYVLVEFYKKYRKVKGSLSVGKFLRGWRECVSQKNFLTIMCGYHNGFQIYADVDVINDRYRDTPCGECGDNDYLQNEHEAERIAEVINNTLVSLEYDWYLL